MVESKENRSMFIPYKNNAVRFFVDAFLFKGMSGQVSKDALMYLLRRIVLLLSCILVFCRKLSVISLKTNLVISSHAGALHALQHVREQFHANTYS